MSVLIETSLGDLVIDLHIDYAPRTCQNFLALCSYHYYNDLLIFSISSTLFRTGCPTNDGSSGESVYALTQPPGSSYIPHEFHPKLTHAKRGTVSMTGGGAEGSGSQFFVTFKDRLHHLDGKHTVFGEVAEGFDTLKKIEDAFVDDNNKPLANIRLRHTIVLYDPFPSIENLPDPGSSPEPVQDPEEATFKEGERNEEVEDELAMKREARSRAEVLEMIGDIGRADLAPPENVLFVCKLNPATTSEDLETVFSRFGKCFAEVKKDQDGESLCYAFVEFEKKGTCERAYFAMDGAIIDDRRIKVDFSQSVSRIAPRGYDPVTRQKDVKVNGHRADDHDRFDYREGRSHAKYSRRDRNEYDDSSSERRRRHQRVGRHRTDDGYHRERFREKGWRRRNPTCEVVDRESGNDYDDYDDNKRSRYYDYQEGFPSRRHSSEKHRARARKYG